jgi:hypothetical protein
MSKLWSSYLRSGETMQTMKEKIEFFRKELKKYEPIDYKESILLESIKELFDETFVKPRKKEQLPKIIEKSFKEIKKVKFNKNDNQFYSPICKNGEFFCPRCDIKMKLHRHYIGMMNEYRLGNEGDIYKCSICGFEYLEPTIFRD